MKKLITLFSLMSCMFYSNAQENGTNMFDESFVHEIHITFEQDDFWDSLEYYYEQYMDFDAPKQYMMASVEIDGTIVDSVGVREKGFYSNWGSDGLKEPLKIDFNEYVPGTKYDGLKKLNLQNGFNDPTMMRDALAYKFMRDAGIAAPRTSYAKVYLNDTYWGLYTVVEQVDDRFLKNNFENSKGNLFKCIDNTSLEWQGPSKSSYDDEFELKTNEELDDWNSFIDLVDKINDEDNFEDSISSALQMNNYLRILAADILMFNWDSYYDHGRNFYIYYDSTASVFQWIPWDYNLAFSNNETDIIPTYGGWMSEDKPLVINALDDDVYRTMYFNHLCVLIDEYFTLDNLESYLDDTKALISDALADDPNKFFTMSQFNTNINSDISDFDDWGFETVYPGLKSFIADRNSTVSGELDDYGHTCTTVGVEELDPEIVAHNVFPNPSNTGLFNVSFADQVNQINVYDLTGKPVHSQLVGEVTEVQLDLTNAANGMYIVELVGEVRQLVRIVKQ